MFHKWTRATTDKFHTLIKDNPTITIRELSDRLGYTQVTISRRLKKYNYIKGWIINGSI